MTAADSARAVAAGADVIYSCIGCPYPAWLQLWPPIVTGLIGAAESTGARLVFADNLYCYGPQASRLSEELPLTNYGRKPALRAEMARTMLDSHRAGRAPVVLARASDFYGPRVLNSAVGERLFPKLLAGKPAQVLGNPDLPHAFTYAADFARALSTLAMAEDDVYGQAWHVPNAPAATQRQVVKKAAAIVGVEPRVQAMPKLMLGVLALFVPILRELKEMMYQWEQSFEVDHTKFAERFWGDATPLEDGLRATVDWYRQREARSGAHA